MTISVTAKRFQEPSQEGDVLICVKPKVVGMPPDVKDFPGNRCLLDVLNDAL